MVKPLIGTCLQMCPYNEIKWREKNNLLHVFEIQNGTGSDPKADPNRIVKQFSRSAAGKLEQSAAELRPSNILLKTTNYLMNDIISLDSVPFVEVYDFINDRVQAIRQDITIQMIEDLNTVLIYEKCLKFYIVSSYILCEEPLAKFDPHLNSKQLQICLEKVIELYQKFETETMNEIISAHLSLQMIHSENFYKSEILFKRFLDDGLVKQTLRLCLSIIDGNFVKFFKSLQKLPLILQLCFFQQFGLIRKQAIKVLNTAYSSANCQFPVITLCKCLGLSERDILELCKMHEIKVENKKVCFSKKNYVDNTTLPKTKNECCIEAMFKDISLAVLINGKLKA